MVGIAQQLILAAVLHGVAVMAQQEFVFKAGLVADQVGDVSDTSSGALCVGEPEQSLQACMARSVRALNLRRTDTSSLWTC